MLDGVVLARKTGAGALKRPVPVALGIRHDGTREIIDFQRAGSKSAAQWEHVLTALHRRELTGEGLEMIGGDGGQGLIAARPVVSHGIPVQRCRTHTMRTILNKVRKADHDAVKADRHAVMDAPSRRRAESAARRFADRWEPVDPRAVACLHNDLDDLLTCLRLQDPCRAKAGQNRQRHRTTVPRGPTPNPAHGNLPGQDLHGPHPRRSLHPRKHIPGNQCPSLTDT